jgi:hypothetical protein
MVDPIISIKSNKQKTLITEQKEPKQRQLTFINIFPSHLTRHFHKKAQQQENLLRYKLRQSRSWNKTKINFTSYLMQLQFIKL